MARQGLMDDSGYDFLEPTDCSNFETCTEVAYQQGIADERPKAFAMGYDSGYQKGKEDALDHCEKCETDQWDALYKAEMKGRADAITDFMCKALTKFYNFDLEHGYPTHADVKDILLDVSNELKEQK